jgi:hypothetical protein
MHLAKTYKVKNEQVLVGISVTDLRLNAGFEQNAVTT